MTTVRSPVLPDFTTGMAFLDAWRPYAVWFHPQGLTWEPGLVWSWFTVDERHEPRGYVLRVVVRG